MFFSLDSDTNDFCPFGKSSKSSESGGYKVEGIPQDVQACKPVSEKKNQNNLGDYFPGTGLQVAGIIILKAGTLDAAMLQSKFIRQPLLGALMAISKHDPRKSAIGCFQ